MASSTTESKDRQIYTLYIKDLNKKKLLLKRSWYPIRRNINVIWNTL